MFQIFIPCHLFGPRSYTLMPGTLPQLRSGVTRMAHGPQLWAPTTTRGQDRRQQGTLRAATATDADGGPFRSNRAESGPLDHRRHTYRSQPIMHNGRRCRKKDLSFSRASGAWVHFTK